MKRMIVTLVMLSVASMAAAQEFNLPPGKWWENERLATAIDLTDDQREQIRERVYAHAHRMIDLKADVQKAELELVNLVMNSDFEADTARKLYVDLQKARQALEMERFEMLLGVRGVLTDEQWQKIQEIRRRFRDSRDREGAPGRRPPERRPPSEQPDGGI
jgi:Spy/CpxP family protein refolding chaperone